MGLSGGFIYACAQPVTEPGYDVATATDGLTDGGSSGTGGAMGTGSGSETVGNTALSSAATTTATSGGTDVSATAATSDSSSAATTMTATSSDSTSSDSTSNATTTDTTTGGAGGATSGESSTTVVSSTTVTSTTASSTAGSSTTASSTTASSTTGSSTTGGGSGCGDPQGEEICDFSEWSGTSSGNWSGENGMSGGWFTYAGTGSSISVTHGSGSLRLSGTVNNYAGFGMDFDACVDASAYSGVAFSIGGAIGAMGQAVLQARTSSNLSTSNGGECASSCKNNEAEYTVPSSSGTVSVSWAQLVDGTPVSPADPGELIGFQWQFHCPTDGACALDVTLDNLRFAD